MNPTRDGCEALAVARICETELDEDPERALRLVYMLEQDLALVLAVVSPRHAPSSRN